ncbi:MAG TPA: hypothetical protein VM165_22920 [Planctomycetaceae bacterium]|nr:hypothetical protein [Planctomycetaceae bacterium]
MSSTIEVRDLTQRWPEVLDSVRRGEVVVIVDATVPQARISPIVRRLAGLHPGALIPTADFDEPLSDEFWVGKP